MATTYKQFTKALSRFESAVREHEMIGAQRPVARAEIEREYIDSKRKVIEAFANKGA